MSYQDYLKGSHWARVKMRYRASNFPQDCICGETENLHLHHMTYERLGREELTDLTPLCAHCHAMVHVLVDRGDLGLDLAGFVSEQRARFYGIGVAKRRAQIQGEITELQAGFYGVLRSLDGLRDAWERCSEGVQQPLRRPFRQVNSRMKVMERMIHERIESGRQRGVAA